MKEGTDATVEQAWAAAEEQSRLAKAWGRPKGIYGWLTTTDHKEIGLRFVVTAFVFFLLGGLEALVMRLQLARPEMGLVSNDLYNQIFSTHGSTMMFLFAVPVMQAMGVYLVPLMVGARNLAFPRLQNFAYYVYLIGGLLLYAGLFSNTGVDTGWFSYVPLAGPEYTPGKRVDVWAEMVTLTELSALATASNLIATILKLRAPGMSIDRMPLFVWAQLVTSFMVIFAMPAVMLASTCLALDRLVGTHFFNAKESGDPLLWQHLFWFFGHPEVYIIFIPALGMISSVVSAFTRRAIFGYLPMVLSLVTTGFVGFGLWVHHMYAAGLPQLGESFFTAASILIAVPSGVQIFCWIATLWDGKVRLRAPLLFVLGFFAIFVLGGLTGVMLASVPIDLQVHDTFFVVAHLHYVLIGGAVFPLFGAFHYWLPKWTGRMPSESAGRWTFALMFVGFNVAFFPMHQLGLGGMTRRIYTYAPSTGFGTLNLVATIGAIVLGLGVALFVAHVFWTRKRGEPAGPDPWKAESLEWAAPSPPPSYNFAELPTVSGRYALWSLREDQPIVTGVSSERPEVLLTRVLDAEPDHRTELPGPSIWPFASAIAAGVTFIGLIFTPWAFVVGGGLGAVALTAWFWPKGPHKELAEEQP